MTMDSTEVAWVRTAGYEGPERRHYSRTVEQLEEHIGGLFKAHEEREKQWFMSFRAECDSAYPNGDRRGHCEAHESMIAAKKAEEEFWHTAKSEALKHGVAGMFTVLKWVAILALLGLAAKFGFGPALAKVLGVQMP